MDPESSASYAHGAEAWRAVPGYEGRHEVSDLGRVRSLLDNRQRVRVAPLIRQLAVRRDGYRRVRLADRNRFVHRLVLEAFVGPCPPGYQGAHQNGDPADNRLVNLAWKTPTENQRDKVGHGTLLTGDRHPARSHPAYLPRGEKHWSRLSAEQLERGERTSGAKVSAEQVREIRAASLRGEKTAALGARYGLTQGAVRRILTRKTWAALADQQLWKVV